MCSFDKWYVWLKLDVVPRTVDLITNGVKQVWSQSQTDHHADSDVDCQRIPVHQILFHVFSNFSIMVSFLLRDRSTGTISYKIRVGSMLRLKE